MNSSRVSMIVCTRLSIYAAKIKCSLIVSRLLCCRVSLMYSSSSCNKNNWIWSIWRSLTRNIEIMSV